jgi:hypothetical protein
MAALAMGEDHRSGFQIELDIDALASAVEDERQSLGVAEPAALTRFMPPGFWPQ